MYCQKLIRELAEVAFFCFLFIANVTAAAAVQESTILQGGAVDERGAFVAGAQVFLADRRGHKYSTQTDKEGHYRFEALSPGQYVLTASAIGFAEFTQPVSLTSSRLNTLDITLRINLREQVDVQVARDNLTLINIAGKEIEALPPDPRQAYRRVRQLARAFGVPGDLTIYVDGFRENGRLPRREAIESIQVNSDPFAAEFAEAGQARIEITTKPATESLHGELNFNFSDESLNARNPFALVRAPLQLRDYNATLTGPIKNNRWGYFLDLGRSTREENAVVKATILTSGTLLPQPFDSTVVTPSRDLDFSFRTNYLLGKRHQLDFRSSHSNSVEHNQGLEDGLDLPERAITSKARDDLFRLSLTSFGERWFNEARFEFSRSRATAVALHSDPTVFVLDSLTGGGNQDQLFSDVLSQRFRFSDNVTYAVSSHTLKAGILIDSVRLEDTSRSNFGGTFTFGTDFERNERGLPVPGPVVITPLESYRRTLLGLTGYRPLQFTINSGDPIVGLTQWDAGLFAQDDWRLGPRLMLSYGLRSEFQTHIQNRLSLAPRAALAVRPFKHSDSTLRVGAGFFYSRIDPEISVDAERFNGRRGEELVVQRPEFFLAIPPVINGATSLTTLRTKAPEMTAPYSFLSTVSYQQKLPWSLSATLSYTWESGVHLLRTRNINAPLPDSPGLRPLPSQGPILQYESSGRSKQHELVVALQGDLSTRFYFFSSYELAFARSDTNSATMAPADSYDLSTEFGRAETDQRHQFYFEADLVLPWRVHLSPNIYAASGAPFNIITGDDNNGDTLFTDRPAFANAGDPGAIITRFGVFNPHPKRGDIIIPRNFGRGAGELSVNLDLSKTFTFGSSSNSKADGESGKPSVAAQGEHGGRAFNRFSRLSDRSYSLTFSVDVINVLNHTNFGEFNGVITSPLFGRPNGADSPRRINMGVRLSF